MATAPSICRKRNRSALNSDLNLRTAVPTNMTTQDVPCMILVHLTALLSCNETVTRVIPAIVAEILPANEAPRFTHEDMLRAFSRFPILQHVLLELGVRPLTCEESVNLVQVYWRIFYEVGASLVTLAPGAKELLEAIRRQSNTALAVIAHSTVEAAKVLAELGVDHLVDTILPALPVDSYVNAVADPGVFWSHWNQFVVPWFTAYCGGASQIPNRTGENGTATTANDGTTLTSNENTTTATDIPMLNISRHSDDNDDKPIDFHSFEKEPIFVPAHALLVSSVLSDLTNPAIKVGGVRTCWFRRVDATDPLAVRACDCASSTLGSPDFVVGALDELRARLFGVVGEEVGRAGANDGGGDGSFSVRNK
ncbi:hypothetical protein C7999DRAFT_18302 [Corynascus novoguineensis]|uniref:Uncharacterized protein n=1 Tax=Corynascus novoguineensis TaxID=1126955 RepID=A0AAN7HB50_9PEZI|nr:hypothetical protein C7999DRAFT_18302 [Corynascus novoguineensis]